MKCTLDPHSVPTVGFQPWGHFDGGPVL
jgi:hypothetical protein